MQTSVLSRIFERAAAATALAALMFVLAPAPASADVQLRLGVGYVDVSGDVGDGFVGPGADFSLGAIAGVSDQLYVGAGLRASALDSRSVAGVDVTQSGARFGIELQLVYYLVPSGRTVRPYVSGSVGYGAIAWEYEDAARPTPDLDHDGVGYTSLTPCAGVDFTLNEKAGLFAEARYSFALYQDETSENQDWDVDGGQFLELTGGFRVKF